MSNLAVPVVMYHSVGIPNRNWQWNSLTCPYQVFENQLKWMKNKGFHTISLQQLYDYMVKGIKLPKNPAVLTFDDGYLDNWLFAYPLLKKYGFIGTIYINPDFIDKRNIIRSNLEDIWTNDIELNEIDTNGYLSWNEMREMEKEGIIDIQSHTMSHTFYEKSNRIIDFRHPSDSYIWLTWNDNPTKKQFLQIDNMEFVNFGKPVYEYGRAIGIRRYFPDNNLDEFIINYVQKNGGKDFFKLKNWKKKLFDLVQEYREYNQINDRYENEVEYEKRINYELKKSKDIIEKKLKKEVKFLCWAGGSVTEKALRTALDIGYISSTVGLDLKNERKYMKNIYGENPSRIKRIDSVLYWNGIEGAKSKVKYKNGFYLILLISDFQNKKIGITLIKIFLAGVKRLYKIIYFR